MFIAVCDGLKEIPEAINTTWEHTVVQQCIVPLIRNSFRYAGRQPRDAIVKALKRLFVVEGVEFGWRGGWRMPRPPVSRTTRHTARSEAASQYPGSYSSPHRCVLDPATHAQDDGLRRARSRGFELVHAVTGIRLFGSRKALPGAQVGGGAVASSSLDRVRVPLR